MSDVTDDTMQASTGAERGGIPAGEQGPSGARPLASGRRAKYFLDTEFIESGPYHPIQLISIGIVSEDGREFYRISSEFERGLASQWVRDNVLNQIPESDFRKSISLREIASELLAFIGDDKPEFWGYYADYDWVVFAQIFGTMMDLPKGWPMYCRDIKQLCDSMGNPKLPEQGKGEHNALADARWNKVAFEFLSGPEWLGRLREALK